MWQFWSLDKNARFFVSVPEIVFLHTVEHKKANLRLEQDRNMKFEKEQRQNLIV